MNTIYDAMISLCLFLITYLSVISIYKLYSSKKFYHDLEELRKKYIDDDRETVVNNKKINYK